MSLGEYLNQNRFDFCRQAPKQPDPVDEKEEVEQQLRIKYGIDSAQAGAHQYKLRQTNCRLKKSIEDGQRCKHWRNVHPTELQSIPKNMQKQLDGLQYDGHVYPSD